MSNPIACVTYNALGLNVIIGHREMCGQVVNEFIHVDLTIDIIKHLFKTNINSECGVPPFPPAGMK